MGKKKKDNFPDWYDPNDRIAEAHFEGHPYDEDDDSIFDEEGDESGGELDEDAPTPQMIIDMLGFDPDELDDIIAEYDEEDRQAAAAKKGSAGSGN